MVIFTRWHMGDTVQGWAAYCSTEEVPVGLVMSWDVLTTSCGVSKEALPLFSLPLISVHPISGSPPIMAAGAISPKSTLRCPRPLSPRSLRGKPISSPFNTGGNLLEHWYRKSLQKHEITIWLVLTLYVWTLKEIFLAVLDWKKVERQTKKREKDTGKFEANL